MLVVLVCFFIYDNRFASILLMDIPDQIANEFLYHFLPV